MKSKYRAAHISAGEQFSGYQKSLSKKSEYFFSELDIQITDVDYKNSSISGVIDKKIISITGKKQNKRVFFDGEIVDGINNTFTSQLTAGCEQLDIYFWNRFPSFKEIESLKDLTKKEHKFVYMRWHEKGQIKKREKVIAKKPTKNQLKQESFKSELNPEERASEFEEFDEDEDELETEFEDYFDCTADETEEELVANGSYFICYDLIQNKITGYFKQAFLKNCQKLILEHKSQGEQGNTFPICEKM